MMNELNTYPLLYRLFRAILVFVFAGVSIGLVNTDSLALQPVAPKPSLPNKMATGQPEGYAESVEQRIARTRDLRGKAEEDLRIALEETAKGLVEQLGGTAEEAAERERLLRDVIHVHDLNIDTLGKLDEVGKAVKEPLGSVPSWQGLPESGPFPLALLDKLRGAVSSTKREIEVLAFEYEMVEKALEEERTKFRDTEAELRGAEETLEGAAETPAGDARRHWLKNMAELRSRYYSAGMAQLDSARELAKERLALRQRELAVMERKVQVLSSDYGFTKVEYEEHVAVIAKERQGYRKELERAARREEKAREELQRLRSTLQSQQASTAAGNEGERANRIRASKEKYDAQRETVQASEEEVRMLNMFLRKLDAEEMIWAARYKMLNGADATTLEEAGKMVRENMKKALAWKTYVSSNQEILVTLQTGLEARLTQWGKDDGDTGEARKTLAAFGERSRQNRRAIDEIDRFLQLLDRFQEDLDLRISSYPFSERLKRVAERAMNVAKNVWNCELFSVEDTVVVDGQAVSGRRTVTIRKLAGVVLILVLGLWLARVITRRIPGLLRRQLRADENVAILAQRGLHMVFVVALVLSAFTVAKIPLTVFTFLGGALAIGAGFGAQNLLNNFLSGIILLLERPLKVGDVMEVDGVRGTIVNVGSRCCQVKRFDGVDILVPNSTLLEKSVVNWTLSDRMTRFSVRIGVAYGTPVREVMKLLKGAVEEHGVILKNPEPRVFFDDFGESSLLFSVYYWVELTADLDIRQVASDLRAIIDRVFREHGITMVYPQRDVHLHLRRPLPVEFMERSEGPASGNRDKETVGAR